MRVIILGSAAGGGLPQWNCGCPNCRAAREQGPGRTQSSVAVSADGERWIPLKASPDPRHQLAAHRAPWALGVARRPPRYARGAPAGTFDVGLRLVDEGTGGTLAYIPTAAAVDVVVERLAARADLLLFDGTFWSDGELRAAGVDAVTAREMGHLPVGGASGSLGALPRLGAKRTVLVHINNTNPILCRGSAERAQLEAPGVHAGDDGN